MAKFDKLGRRTVLRGGIASGLALAAPALIGRAAATSAQNAFAVESMIAVA